jgi:hypothetical protein
MRFEKRGAFRLPWGLYKRSLLILCRSTVGGPELGEFEVGQTANDAAGRPSLRLLGMTTFAKDTRAWRTLRSNYADLLELSPRLRLANSRGFLEASHARSSVGFQGRRNLHGNQEVAG